MKSHDKNFPAEETHIMEDQPQGSGIKRELVKVHIEDETFYCNPEKLSKYSRFFAAALAGPVKEITLPHTAVTAGAFCALYGWISAENTPFVTHRALEGVPVAAAYLHIIPPLDDFWFYTHLQQMRMIKERIVCARE